MDVSGLIEHAAAAHATIAITAITAMLIRLPP